MGRETPSGCSLDLHPSYDEKVGFLLHRWNVELLRISKDLGDYVIVHELLHFSVPNHGRLWKSLMRAHLGEYERLEERLRRIATEEKE